MLYGISNQNRLYTLDPGTGAANLVAPLGTQPFFGQFGIDFSPVQDALRVITPGGEAGQPRNLLVNPDTGQVTASGLPRYAPGDPNAGRTVRVFGSAYTNNFAGAPATMLYNIETNVGVLVRQDPESEGLLTTVGPLGVSAGSAFDISGVTGTAYATGTIGGIPQLYTVNLDTGAATLMGTIGAGTTPILLVGLSAAPALIPEPTTLALLCMGLMGAGAAGRRRRRAGASARA